MSCENCEITQENSVGKAYYRWKNANIEIDGCDKHLLEVFEALNKAQAPHGSKK